MGEIVQITLQKRSGETETFGAPQETAESMQARVGGPYIFELEGPAGEKLINMEKVEKVTWRPSQ
ncbi:hypothetical protein [Saccharopolyspora griseoalba]|uniref:Uncharacterized protein n=1 Tax=Saccharopolyspora griseoalba TaxID=1431848 RepID=A0ABW2LTK2_9PSEU